MVSFLAALCALFFLLICVLSYKVFRLRQSADEIRMEFGARLQEDTNIGIDISSGDKKMRRLAAAIDRQLKLLRRAQLRCLQGDRELKEAVANISHDLRTPLTAICGYLELLEKESKSPQVQEYLEIITNRTEALKKLTEELFRYFLATSDGFYTEKACVSLKQAVEEGVAGFYAVLKQKGIEPEICLPETDVVRMLNKEALTRILENILGNAVKYSGGDLEIRLEEDGTLCFSNLAPDLDKVAAGRLFDRFYTVETARRSTGLGLSIAKMLTEQQGGVIASSYAAGRLRISVRF
ncbi:MAG: sensor histidine kinase [Clostridia bacterium]